MDLCVDNAAMIAGLGSYTLASRGYRGDGLDLGAFASGSREPAPVGGALI